jgi:myo-inositol-1(or 4)-monophosphatase
MNLDTQKIIDAALKGGEVVKHYFGQALQTHAKTTLGDLRTQADVESEQAIIQSLTQSFPTYNIYAEESGQTDNHSDYTFVIDPLDGTSNFVMGIPDFAISIGLLHGDEAIFGVIYNPILDQLYTAQKGKGAFLNGKRIHVNTEDQIARSTISYTCGYNTPRDYTDRIIGALRQPGVKRIVDHWAPAFDYCLLAAGRIEAVISKDGDLEDYVAAKVIVTEAGGKVTNFAGQPEIGKNADFVATNGQIIHDEILRIMR